MTKKKVRARMKRNQSAIEISRERHAAYKAHAAKNGESLKQFAETCLDMAIEHAAKNNAAMNTEAAK